MRKIKTFKEFIQKTPDYKSLNAERLNTSLHIWDVLRAEHLDTYFRRPVMQRIDNQRIINTYFDSDQSENFYKQEVGWFESIFRNNKPSLVCPWKFSKEFKNCNFEVLDFIIATGVKYHNYYSKLNPDVCIKFQPYDTENRMKKPFGILRYSIDDDVWYWDGNYMGKLMSDEVTGDVAKLISVLSIELNPETKYQIDWFQEVLEPEEIK